MPPPRLQCAPSSAAIGSAEVLDLEVLVCQLLYPPNLGRQLPLKFMQIIHLFIVDDFYEILFEGKTGRSFLHKLPVTSKRTRGFSGSASDLAWRAGGHLGSTTARISDEEAVFAEVCGHRLPWRKLRQIIDTVN